MAAESYKLQPLGHLGYGHPLKLVVGHFVNLSFCQMTKISYTMWLKNGWP